MKPTQKPDGDLAVKPTVFNCKISDRKIDLIFVIKLKGNNNKDEDWHINCIDFLRNLIEKYNNQDLSVLVFYHYNEKFGDYLKWQTNSKLETLETFLKEFQGF